MGIVTDGLAGYYHFSDVPVPTGTESSSINKLWNNISPNGSTSYVEVKPYYYEVQTDSIYIKSSNASPILMNPTPNLKTGTTSFGFDFWIQTSTPFNQLPQSPAYIMQWRNVNVSFNLEIWKGGAISLNYNSSDTPNYTDSVYILPWTMVSAYYDITDKTVSFYIDGEFVTKTQPASSNFSFSNYSEAFIMGFLPKFRLASIRYYERVLTSDEVMQNYLVGYQETGLSAFTAPPSQPTNLVATNIGGESLTLQWDEVAETESYKIKRNGVEIANIEVAVSPSTSFTDTGLASNTTYNYEVIAVNDLGESPPASLSVKTLDFLTVTIVEDFEDEDYKFSHTGVWNITTIEKVSGLNSIKSPITNPSSSSLETFTIEIPSSAFDPKVFFYYKTSSDIYDLLRVRLDGIEILSASGEVDWTLFEGDISVGTHTLEFEYRKDLYLNDGYDAVFIDDLKITYNVENLGQDVPPQVTIVNVDKSKISDEAGMDRTIVSFKFSADIVEYKVLINGVDHNTGILADSGGEVTADTEVTAEIDFTELSTDGLHRINIYGCNMYGTWTFYDS